MLKKFISKSVLALFSATLSPSLFGLYSLDGEFTLRGEWLIFKPSIDQSYYAISSSNNRFGEDIFPDGTRYNNNPDFSSGFRLEGIYTYPNCQRQLDFRFTRFSTNHSDHVTGPFLFDVIGYPGDGAQAPEDASYAGTARSHEHFGYYGADLTMNRFLIRNCNKESFSFLFGLHYANVEFKESFSSTGAFIDDGAPVAVNNHLTQDSQFWGIGPQIGFDYHYLLPNFVWISNGAFSLEANARASLLCSRTETTFHYDTVRTGPVGVNLQNRPIWRVTPSVDARLGLKYNLCEGCFNATFEVGYEVIWYGDCINSIVGNDVAFPGNSIDVYSNLNLQGPYMSLSVAF